MPVFLDNATLHRFIADRVNLPKSKEAAFKKQVRHLTDQFDRYAKAHPELEIRRLVQSGSLGKRTHTAQLNDIDIVAYVDLGPQDDRSVQQVHGPRILQLVRNTVAEVYGVNKRSGDIRKRKSAVGVQFSSGLSVDVVPVIIDHATPVARREGWVIRDRSPKVRTCIWRHQEFVKRVHREHPNFLELVRLLKWWRTTQRNDRHPDLHLRSTLIELTAAHLARSGRLDPNRPLDAVRTWFEWVASEQLSQPIWFEDFVPGRPTAPERPLVTDPANPLNNVAETYVHGRWKLDRLVQYAAESARLLDQAYSATTKSDAKDAAALVFGPDVKAAFSKAPPRSPGGAQRPPSPDKRSPMSKKQPSPNDQRSNAKNPNNSANKAARDNRANQLNPNHAPSKGGKKKG